MDVNVAISAGLNLIGFNPNKVKPKVWNTQVYSPLTVPDLYNIRSAQANPSYAGPFIYMFDTCVAKASAVALSIEVLTPGLYKLDNLYEHSIGLFDTVLFLEPGTYSLTSIYKTAKESGEKFSNFRVFIPNEDFEKALTSVKLLNALKYSAFSRVLPVGVETLEEVHAHPVWKNIFQKIQTEAGLLKEEVKEEVIENWADDLLKLNDRFIPVVANFRSSGGYHHLPEFSRHEMFWINKENKPVDAFAHPFEGGKHLNKSTYRSHLFGHLHQMIIQWCANGRGTHGATQTGFFAFHYDTVTHDFVLSQELEHQTHYLIKENLDNFKNCLGFPEAAALYAGRSGFEFRDALNAQFAERGFSKLKVTFAYPTVHKPYLQVRHYQNENGMREHIDEDWTQGFWIQVSYNGHPILGNKSRQSGCVSVQDDGRMSLIESSWCQRVSKWSKHTAQVIDQHNKHWQIADWLVGPFAEQFGLHIDEAPFVYMGNHAKNTKQRKAEILEKLRQGLV